MQIPMLNTGKACWGKEGSCVCIGRHTDSIARVQSSGNSAQIVEILCGPDHAPVESILWSA